MLAQCLQCNGHKEVWKIDNYFFWSQCGGHPKACGVEHTVAKGLYTRQIKFKIKCTTNQSPLKPPVEGGGFRGLFLPLTNNCLWLNLVRHLFTEQIFLERGPVCYYINIMENIGNRKRLHVNPQGMSHFFIADCLNELDWMNTPQHVQWEQINIVF